MFKNKFLSVFFAVSVLVGGWFITSGQAMAASAGILAQKPTSPTYSQSFFGMIGNGLTMFGGTDPFPSFPVTTWRLWDAGNPPPLWAQINTAANTYDFTKFDAYVNSLLAAGITNITYNMGETPDFAASLDPGAGVCLYGYVTAGAKECAPPTCENYASSPPVCSVWTNWVNAVTLEAKRLGGGTNCAIQHFEMWNEVNMYNEWTGTIAQMVALEQLAYPIIHTNCPNADVLTPSVITLPIVNPQYLSNVPCPATSSVLCDGQLWALLFLQAGGATYADELNYHNYSSFIYGSGNFQPAELAVQSAQYFSNLAASYGLSTTVSTEAGYATANYTSAQQADYAVKYTAIMHSYVPRSFWYAYDNPSTGTLYSGGLNAAGTAYGIMEQWLAGSVVVSDVHRVASNNIVRNTNATGCVPGTPGTLPTYWSSQFVDSANGITTSIACGSGYIDFTVSGTCTGGCNNVTLINMENGLNGVCQGAGQQVWASIQQQVSPISTGGYSSGNMAVVSGISEYNAAGSVVRNDGGNSAWATPTLSYSSQPTIVSLLTQNASCKHLAPSLAFYYPTGVPVNQTIRIGAASLDTGTQWVGNYVTASGAPAILAWDSGSGSTLTGLSPQFGHYQDDAGGMHTITGGSVTLTNSPVWITP